MKLSRLLLRSRRLNEAKLLIDQIDGKIECIRNSHHFDRILVAYLALCKNYHITNMQTIFLLFPLFYIIIELNRSNILQQQ